MDMDTAGASRVSASTSRLDRARASATLWLTQRREADKALSQYASQLDAVDQVLSGCFTQIEAIMPAETNSLPDIYSRCWAIDRRIVWTTRLLAYFADRFGNRNPVGADDRNLCLLAADEVVWSSWRRAYSTIASDVRPAMPTPAPLPFLDAVHAPEVFPPSLVPTDLGSLHVDAPFVREHLAALPVPMVRLPVGAVSEPWQLALLAHETGHHLQFANRLTAPFTNAVEAAVRDAGGNDAAVQRWAGWSVEIFADLVSVVLLGPWALWPIAELELSTQSSMVRQRPGYPPAGIRLTLIARAVAELGLDPDVGWPPGAGAGRWDGGDLPVPASDPEQPDAAFVSTVVQSGLAIAPNGLALADWLRFRESDFGPNGPLQRWCNWLSGRGVRPATERSVTMACLVAGAAVCATAAARASKTGSEETLATVRMRTFQAIISMRMPGRRAVGTPVQSDYDSAALGLALANAHLADQRDPFTEETTPRSQE